MKAFVTGGTGLLGETGATLVVGDLLEVEGFAHALHGCDALFHTAAYFHETFQPATMTTYCRQSMSTARWRC
ncbi:hypothetical protein ACIP5Y_40700 [Nocardia sp. NPDC088792]|uniref:hypothetical protein n=1 Tax=Nocardia sp. NPDC088792 TaxID=3364332 RepID=UPI0038059DDC